MNPKLLERANELVKTFTSAGLAVIDENGYPSVSAVSLVRPENISEVYFTTSLDSNKVKRLQQNNRASICCYDNNGSANITLVGECEILTDQESKSKYWLDWFAQIYEGETDPNYCVVKFNTRRVSLWIDDESAEFNV